MHLTPIGTYQYLYYTVAKNIIIVKNHSNLPTHCSYIVYGERKDGEPLIPEYEGNSPEDYPGKNDQYSIAGYHYDRSICFLMFEFSLLHRNIFLKN